MGCANCSMRACVRRVRFSATIPRFATHRSGARQGLLLPTPNRGREGRRRELWLERETLKGAR